MKKWITVEEYFEALEAATSETTYAKFEPELEPWDEPRKYVSASIIASDIASYVDRMPRGEIFSMRRAAEEYGVNPKTLRIEFKKYCSAMDISYKIIPARGFIIF